MKEKRKNSNTLIIAGVLVVALGAGAWGLTIAFSEPPPDDTEKLLAQSPEDLAKLFDELRRKRDDASLTDEQRKKFDDQFDRLRDARQDQAVAEYYAASEEDRVAVLDKQIDEMEKWRKAREDRQREEEEKARASGKTEEEREKEREQERDRWRRDRENRSKAERKADSETRNPNQRAQRMAYRRAMREQMKARGIEPPRWGGGGGRGGPGRG
jgi:hypothetical protein